MAGQVYFGNKNYQTWIPSPLSEMSASSAGYAQKYDYLNGRSFVKRSRASHREFSPSWLGSMNNTTLANGLQVVKNFQDGVYGDGPYYWCDPYAIDQNMMPPHWAMPALVETDWPSHFPAGTSGLTKSFTSAAQTNDYPYRYISYTATGAVTSNKIVLIIPSTHTLNFGWFSTSAGISAATTGGMRITPYLRSTGAAGTVINPASLAAGATGSSKFNTTIDGATYSYVEITFAFAAAATVAFIGMIAQIVLTSGGAVSSNGFVHGKGTVGLEFGSFSDIQYYPSAINNGQIGLASSLIEVD